MKQGINVSHEFVNKRPLAGDLVGCWLVFSQRALVTDHLNPSLSMGAATSQFEPMKTASSHVVK